MKAVITLESENEFKEFMAGKLSKQTEGTREDGEEAYYTQEEAERYKIASDLATVCEYLEDSEVIKIRLIISKCEERREKEESV